MAKPSPPPADYAGVPLPEVQVITNRLLSAETTEAVLNALDVIPNIRQINMTGESCDVTQRLEGGRGGNNVTKSPQQGTMAAGSWHQVVAGARTEVLQPKPTLTWRVAGFCLA